MPYLYYSWDWTFFVFIIPAMIIAFIAQIMVNSAYSKYSQVNSRSGFTGAMMARKMLDDKGLFNVRIEKIRGNLTDHYDPRSNVIRLSAAVHDSTSVAAIGIAAHEAGHAIQYAESYGFIKLRNAIIPLTRFSSPAAIILILVGFFLTAPSLIYLGIILYSVAVLFQIITLPVEFNASGRALRTIRDTGILDSDELGASKKVLSAAALTYVAALISSIATLLRLLVLANRRR